MLVVDSLKVHGLAPASFEVPSGGCLVVRGASGTGKTLLLRALADLDPAPGRIVADGIERFSVPGPEWRRRVRYCSAEPGWWAEIAEAHFSDIDRALGVAAALGLHAARFGQPVAELSTGERQRLALVRALEDDPPVILLDEPTAALDEASTAKVEALLADRLEAGASLVLVTHSLEQARRIGASALMLQDGEAWPMAL